MDCDVFGVTNQINIKTNISKSESFIELVSPAWPQWASFDSTLQICIQYRGPAISWA